MRMLVRLVVSRGWRAILVSDCGAEGKGVFELKGLGGIWLVVFNGRCGVVLDPGMAKMWRRGGERRHDAPDGRSLAVVIPRAGRGFRGRVFVSCVGLWSGFCGGWVRSRSTSYVRLYFYNSRSLTFSFGLACRR